VRRLAAEVLERYPASVAFDRASHVIDQSKAKTSKRLLLLQGGLEAKARWYERLLLTSAVKPAEPAVP
jgi:hypothetical protein